MLHSEFPPSRGKKYFNKAHQILVKIFSPREISHFLANESCRKRGNVSISKKVISLHPSGSYVIGSARERECEREREKEKWTYISSTA